MVMRLKKRKGKVCIVIDTRPSKAIRKAEKRIQKRMREIYQHLGHANYMRESEDSRNSTRKS